MGKGPGASERNERVAQVREEALGKGFPYGVLLILNGGKGGGPQW